MDETLTTFLYELANFVVFAALLGWIFVKPIRRLLDEQAAQDAKLEQTAQQHLAEAADLRQQLLNDQQTFSQQMEHQRQAILSETKQDAAKLLQQANQKIQLQREHLSSEVLQIQQQQLNDLARIVASSSQQAVENLLKQINGPLLENALIESACQQLNQSQLSGEEKMTVESAGDLDDNERQMIAVAAGVDASAGHIDYQVDPSLLGGLRIKTSRGMIDNSILALSSFAEQNILRQLHQAS